MQVVLSAQIKTKAKAVSSLTSGDGKPPSRTQINEYTILADELTVRFVR